MSVINKMLRDLDQRQSPTDGGAADALRRNTASVAAMPVARRRSAALRWATALLPVAAMVAGAFVWWSFQHMPPPEPAVALAPTLAPAPIVAPAPMAEPAASAAMAEPAPVVAAVVTPEPVVALAAPAALAVAPATAGPVASGLRPAPSSTEPMALPKPVPAALAPAVTPASKVPASPATVAVTPPATAAPPPAKAPAPVPELPSAAARQQQAGREALAQAQSLWASGARESAIGSLHEAVAAAERGTQGGVGAAATLVPLVRELARMELAEGRAAAVWDLLLRLEPLLVNQPELWAMRANAAQRLGRHQESVLAYTTALQARPSEQRWLLGTAVSLAALGQTGPAAEMADKARAVGPVSREVLAYLRQQGVPLTDRP